MSGDTPEDGDGSARDVPMLEWWPEAYADLKQLARSRLRRSGPLTLLDTTSLVNESFLKLSARGKTLSAQSRGQFFAYASSVMRSIIVDLVRERNAAVHGGGLGRVSLHTGLLVGSQSSADVLRVDEALRSLEALEPRLAQIVQLRYFGGLTEVEIGDITGLSERTVRRDWDKARALLRTMLDD